MHVRDAPFDCPSLEAGSPPGSVPIAESQYLVAAALDIGAPCSGRSLGQVVALQ